MEELRVGLTDPGNEMSPERDMRIGPFVTNSPLNISEKHP